MFGKGEPLLPIPGSSMRMDDWEPDVLNKLASNHTVMIFDNRGIGKTTAGNKTWSVAIARATRGIDTKANQSNDVHPFNAMNDNLQEQQRPADNGVPTCTTNQVF